MAAACTSEETESFVTCSICLCEYDTVVRKPKFLPCAHTLCLKCLKVINVLNSKVIETTCYADCVHLIALPGNSQGFCHHLPTLSQGVSSPRRCHKSSQQSLCSAHAHISRKGSSSCSDKTRFNQVHFHITFPFPCHQSKTLLYLGNQLHSGALPVEPWPKVIASRFTPQLM